MVNKVDHAHPNPKDSLLRLKLTAALIFAFAVAAHAQPQGTPVDQSVGDLDKLSVSHRVVNPGIRSDGEHTSLYQIQPQEVYEITGRPISTTNQQTAYYRVAPGVNATFDRLEYLVRSRQDNEETAMNVAPRYDGQFFEIVPANTVFVLSPETEPARETIENEARQDWRVDGRVDRSVDLRIDRRVDNRVTDDTHARFGRRTAGNQGDGHHFVGVRPYDATPIQSLSIRRTSSTRPATNATTPPVSDGSTQSN
jgi:hypothetical protein